MERTPEAILALAPDAASVRASIAIASARRWHELGTDEASLWGGFQGSEGLYHVAALLAEPSFSCTCPSKKKPCKHGLALLLMHARDPGAFTRGEPPPWLVEARARAQPAARRGRAAGPVADPEAQAKRAAEREARIALGLDELERWLRDLVRQGLAVVHGRGYEVFDEPGARLGDAQALGLARRVRALAGVAASGPGWEERLVERLGSLWLLAQAYRRQAELPAELRAEVRTLVGWTVAQDELLAGPGVRDRWLVLGRRVEEDERYQSQRLWLWGRESGRPALLLSFAAVGAPLDRSLPVGTTVDAELAFYPGPRAQRALVKANHGVTPGVEPLPGGDVDAAHAARAAGLAENAWLEEQALALRAVVPQKLGEQWVVRDAAGRFLPLSRRFTRERQLHALAGGRPLDLFGEWSARDLLPLGAAAGGRYVALDA